MCSGLTNGIAGMMSQISDSVPTNGESPSPQAEQASLARAYDGIGKAFSDTASRLTGLPAPSITNGDQLASKFITAFDALGSAYSQAAAAFAAAPVVDKKTLDVAQNLFTQQTEAIQKQLTSELGDLGSQFPAGLQTAVQQLPECKIMSSVGG